MFPEGQHAVLKAHCEGKAQSDPARLIPNLSSQQRWHREARGERTWWDVTPGRTTKLQRQRRVTALNYLDGRVFKARFNRRRSDTLCSPRHDGDLALCPFLLLLLFSGSFFLWWFWNSKDSAFALPTKTPWVAGNYRSLELLHLLQNRHECQKWDESSIQGQRENTERYQLWTI